MARNAIESDFLTSKMATENKILHQSEMHRNAIESEFQTSKMAAGSHFINTIHKNKNCGIDLKW